MRRELLELVRAYGREVKLAAFHELAADLGVDVEELCDCGGTREDHDEEAQRFHDRIEAMADDR